jgi:hypothetical protein
VLEEEGVALPIWKRRRIGWQCWWFKCKWTIGQGPEGYWRSLWGIRVQVFYIVSWGRWCHLVVVWTNAPHIDVVYCAVLMIFIFNLTTKQIFEKRQLRSRWAWW